MIKQCREASRLALVSAATKGTPVAYRVQPVLRSHRHHDIAAGSTLAGAIGTAAQQPLRLLRGIPPCVPIRAEIVPLLSHLIEHRLEIR